MSDTIIEQLYGDEKVLSAETDIPVRTLQSQRQRGGGLPYIKIGRKVLYDLKASRERLRQLERTSTSHQPASNRRVR